MAYFVTFKREKKRKRNKNLACLELNIKSFIFLQFVRKSNYNMTVNVKNICRKLGSVPDLGEYGAPGDGHGRKQKIKIKREKN